MVIFVALFENLEAASSF